MINRIREVKMKQRGIKELENIAKSGPLSSAAAEYEINRRKKQCMIILPSVSV